MQIQLGLIAVNKVFSSNVFIKSAHRGGARGGGGPPVIVDILICHWKSFEISRRYAVHTDELYIMHTNTRVITGTWIDASCDSPWRRKGRRERSISGRSASGQQTNIAHLLFLLIERTYLTHTWQNDIATVICTCHLGCYTNSAFVQYPTHLPLLIFSILSYFIDRELFMLTNS